MNFARFAAPLAALAVFAAVVPCAAQPKQALPDATIGRPDAPVTVIEYSSLGCSHCATFHATVLPRIKTDYIDTGKVRWIVRDFPLGQLPLAGAVTARCAGPSGYLGLIEVLFRTQDSWMDSKDPLAALEKTARQAGIGKQRFDACLADKALIDGIMDRAQEVQKSKTVTATPTFLVGDERVVGLMPFEEFSKIIDKHLKAAPKGDKAK